jgi:hypothetical protein
MLLLGTVVCAYSQGRFQYDQQSSVENQYVEGGAGLGQQPLGQSFTPSLSAVGFVRIYLYGSGPATVYMNLRSNSITGSILGTTPSMIVTSTGPANFVFSSPVDVSPGETYYFQPVLQFTGGGWGTFIAGYNYAGGVAYIDGFDVPTKDFWFREGIIVPEPTSFALFGISALALLFSCRRGRERLP